MRLKNISRQMRGCLRLTPGDRRLFLEAFFLHIWVWFILLFIPFRKLPELFANPSVTGSNYDRIKLNQVRLAVRRASEILPFRNRCLVSSLAARRILKRRRIESELSLGVAKIDGVKIRAHAWISSDGVEIVEQMGDYKVLYLF